MALRLALDPEPGEGVGQDHQRLGGEPHEHHVGVDGRVGERAVGHRTRPLGDDGDPGDVLHRHPPRAEQGGDVVVAGHLVERGEAVGHRADAAVAVIGPRGREGAVDGVHPEDAPRGDPAGATVRQGRRHGSAVVGHTGGRLGSEGDGDGRRRGVEGGGEGGVERGPGGDGHGPDPCTAEAVRRSESYFLAAS